MERDNNKSHMFALTCVSVAGFFVLAGYNFVRAATPSLFIQEFGRENLPVSLAIMTFCSFLTVYLYSKVLTVLGPKKTFVSSCLLSMAMLGGGAFAITQGHTWFSGVLHIYKDLYIVLLVEQLWSFFNSTLNVKKSKVYSGILMGLMSIGPVLAGFFVKGFAKSIGTVNLLYFPAMMLIPVLISMYIGYTKCGEPKPVKEIENKERSGVFKDMSFAVFKERPQLFFLLLTVLNSQFLSAMTTLRFQDTVGAAITATDARTAYFGGFFAWVNAGAGVLQFIGAPLALRFLPVGLIHQSIPFVHLGLAIWAYTVPGLASASAALFLYKAIDYSLFRASKEILYVPLSFEVRYRTKQIIDIWGYRTGKGGTALVLAAFKNVGVAMSAFYSPLALLACGFWACSAYPLAKLSSKEEKIQEKLLEEQTSL